MQPGTHRLNAGRSSTDWSNAHRFNTSRLMKRLLAGLLLMVVGAGTQAWAAPCPPAGWTLASLEALKTRSFQVSDQHERMALAEGLLPCLADPDPALRDGIAYDALSHWMRPGDFGPDALRSLQHRLDAMLDGDESNGSTPGGFARPFSALALAEVARTDRVQPWMTASKRVDRVARSTGYLRSVQDYRGFDTTQDWRHGVAHGADWLMQLSLNPALSPRPAGRHPGGGSEPSGTGGRTCVCIRRTRTTGAPGVVCCCTRAAFAKRPANVVRGLGVTYRRSG